MPTPLLDDEVLRPTNLAGLKVTPAGNMAPNINMLIYGQAGVGKTLLAGSAEEVPQLRRVLGIDIEGGMFTLRQKYPNVDTVRVTDWNQLSDVYNVLRAGAYQDYRTVIVDSLTEAQIFNMDAIMRAMIERTTEEDKERDPDIASLQEWQKNQTQIKRFIRLFRDLPVTTIFTALEKSADDKSGAQVRRRILPDLPGKLAGQVPGIFDEVLYYYIKAVPTDDGETRDARLLLTSSTSKIAAKDRSGKLPTVIENPTMMKLYNLMIGESK